MDLVKNKEGPAGIPHMLLVVTGRATVLYAGESTRGESTKIAEHNHL